MNPVRLPCLVAMMSISAMAWANDPSGQAQQQNQGTIRVDAGLLGQFEGVIDFCANADPQSASTYRLIGRSLTRSLSAHKIEEARESADYRRVYRGITWLLNAIPNKQRKRACANMFAPN
jgi:hypothetical protein